MDEKATDHVPSAAAFVEGGIQEACDDACSICLEPFCEGDPSTVTGCKHEFHLQCILEWCQRSSQCPMCWQPISFKDSTSQELLEAVEKERNLRFTRPRNAAIFHHPSIGEFELQHLPVGANDTELEERIFQHLAAAAAMGRVHLARREGRRGRSGTHGRPQYFVFSADANTVPPSASSAQRGLDSERIPASASVDHSTPDVGENISSHASHPILIRSPQVPLLISGSDNTSINDRNSPSQSEEGAGPSDFHSFSESLKSRFCAVSTKYKESIAKATRGWKERLFSRTTNVADSASENRVEVAPRLTTISNMMEHLDTREASRLEDASVRHHVEGHLVAEPTTSSPIERHENMKRDLNTTSYCATSSDSS